MAAWYARPVSGTLFVVATPIGHLDDISLRALDTLRSVQCIACEDTRRTSRLLARHGIRASLVSLHRFNERERLPSLVERLRRGERVALVSDGGTPAISDPGARLVRAALDAGLAVSPVPGPSAVTALLSACGLPADRYVFEGFLPHRAGERRRRLRELAGERRTLVLFEAPHRVLDTLRDLGEVLGPRTLVLGRELTKRHETILRGRVEEVAQQLERPVRGEITLAVAGAEEAGRHDEPAARRLRQAWHEALQQSGGDRRAALRSAARDLGLRRAELYRRLAELGETPEG